MINFVFTDNKKKKFRYVYLNVEAGGIIFKIMEGISDIGITLHTSRVV